MRKHIAEALQVAGLGCGVVAGALVDAALGFATAAVGLLLIGIAEERKRNDAS